MSETFFMLCAGCGRQGITIRNLCASCNPEAHRKWEMWLAYYTNASVEYTRATGLDPLADFDAFNAWAVAHGLVPKEEAN